MPSSPPVFFWGGPFSQWASSPFIVAGVQYVCAEQFMMRQKALLFGDVETAKQIMLTSVPRDQQNLGRAVAGFQDEIWLARARYIVYVGSMAKYSQNQFFLAKLLGTGDARLVEASPHDSLWGIGLRAEDPRALDPAQWRGKNWLGQVLAQVRDALRMGLGRAG